MEQKRRLGGIREKSWGMTLSGLALVGLLGGCGGGGGSVTAGVDPPAAVSGVVADGYLRGATVCLDVNGNKACDSGEPTALPTGAGGKYTIEAAALALLPEGKAADDYPILVEVTTNAIDEDTIDDNNPLGVRVSKPYVMAAPAGKPEFVSPMTTLIQDQIESNPALTASAAETLVKAAIGVSADSSLFENYVEPVVANKTPEQIQARAEELARVHKVAQVVARTMAEMKESVEQVAGVDRTADYTAIVKLVTEEVMTRLQTINDAVTQTTGTFNPQTVVSQVATIDPNTVTAKIEAKSTVIAKSSFAKMLEGEGTFWLDRWMDYGVSSFEYGNVKLPAGTSTPVEAHFTRMNGAWVADSDTESPDFVLTATGWQEFSDSAANYTVTFNADGSTLLTHTVTGFQETLSAVELDLSGKSHQSIAGPLAELLVDPAATFPADAKGYKLTFVPQQEVYAVYTWTNSAGLDDNYVRYWNQNQEIVLTSLDQVQSAFAQGSGNYLHLDGNAGVNLAVQFGREGQLYCFKQPWDRTKPSVTLEKPGTWTSVQVMGQTFIKLLVPDLYKAGFNLEGDPLLVVKDGMVKRGDYRPAGKVVLEKELNFNKLAFDSLAGNLNYDYVPTGGTDPGTGGGTDPGTGGITDPGTGGGTDPGTGGGTDPGTGGGTFVDPPPLSDIMFISPGEFMDRTFLVREGEFGLTLVTFQVDGSLSGLDGVETANGMEVSTFEGTWSVNEFGHLEAIGADGETTTLRKLQVSTSEALHIYFEDSRNGQPVASGYEVFETTMPFTDPSGLTLVGSDGVTVVFDPAGNGNSGSVTDSLDNSSNLFDWNLQNGVLTLFLDNGEVVTLYLLQSGSTSEVVSIVGFDREATGAVLDVFQDVMTVVSGGGVPQ